MKKYKKKTKAVSKAVKAYVENTLDKRIEDKYSTVDLGGVDPITPSGANTIWQIAPTPQMTQGAGSQQRLGDAVRLKNLDMIITMTSPQTYNSYGRILLVKYKDQNRTALTIDDFMVNTAGVGVNRPLYPKFKLNETIDILYDRIIDYNDAKYNAAVNGKYFHHIRIRKNFKNLKVTFDRNANYGDYRDVDRNGIWLVILGSPLNDGYYKLAVDDIQYTLTYEDA